MQEKAGCVWGVRDETPESTVGRTPFPEENVRAVSLPHTEIDTKDDVVKPEIILVRLLSKHWAQ